MPANGTGKVQDLDPRVIESADQVTVKEFLQVAIQSAEVLDKVSEPAQKLAAALLK